MAFCTLRDIEIATEQSFSDHDIPRIQYLIDSCSAFINSYIGYHYGVVYENVTERFAADGVGKITLPAPTTLVTTIAPVLVYDPFPAPCGYWNGLDDIWNLDPYHAYDITYTYGTPLVPEELKYVAIEAIGTVLEGEEPDQITEKTIGDITYKFKWSEENFNSLQMQVLKDYRGDGMTWHV